MTQITQWYKALDNHIKFALIGLLSAIIGVSAWVSYNWYTVYQNQKSQIVVSECLQEYQKTFESDEQLWPEIELMSDLALNQVSGALQPFVYVIKAQALARQGKYVAAYDLLDQVDKLLVADSPYKSYYTLTKSLMLLDAEDANLKEQGIELLKKLAYDSQNVFQDASLYYLGDYYWSQNTFEQAKLAWQQLVDGAETIFKGSPWIAVVEPKLSTL